MLMRSLVLALVALPLVAAAKPVDKTKPNRPMAPRRELLPEHVSHIDVEAKKCPTAEPCIYFDDSAFVLRKNGEPGSFIVDVGLPDLPILRNLKTKAELADRVTKALLAMAKRLNAPTVKLHCSAIAGTSGALAPFPIGPIRVAVPTGEAAAEAPKPITAATFNQQWIDRLKAGDFSQQQPLFDERDVAAMTHAGLPEPARLQLVAARKPREDGTFVWARFWVLSSPTHHDVYALDRSTADLATDEQSVLPWLRKLGVKEVELPRPSLCDTPTLIGGEWLERKIR